jgi:hypothetical protein
LISLSWDPPGYGGASGQAGARGPPHIQQPAAPMHPLPRPGAMVQDPELLQQLGQQLAQIQAAPMPLQAFMQGPQAAKRCACKKARCLKLYCVCFAAGARRVRTPPYGHRPLQPPPNTSTPVARRSRGRVPNSGCSGRAPPPLLIIKFKFCPAVAHAYGVGEALACHGPNP